jgi:hypothetical protein
MRGPSGRRPDPIFSPVPLSMVTIPLLFRNGTILPHLQCFFCANFLSVWLAASLLSYAPRTPLSSVSLPSCAGAKTCLLCLNNIWNMLCIKVSARKMNGSGKISGFCNCCRFRKYHITLLKLCRNMHWHQVYREKKSIYQYWPKQIIYFYSI